MKKHSNLKFIVNAKKNVYMYQKMCFQVKYQMARNG